MMKTLNHINSNESLEEGHPYHRLAWRVDSPGLQIAMEHAVRLTAASGLKGSRRQAVVSTSGLRAMMELMLSYQQ